ncbi:hypothetical protein CEXT_29251 [Caerostris extrusa]|uniref:Uncharacterized protein n=1 Tax=Caerostris extrusa TaxID=172846 RepID=A0AAV4Q938_CAEEX|nr:hypothetical protein CEXT_29251 [Caerostris extrusa]
MKKNFSFDKSKKPDSIHHFIQVPRTESPYPRIFPPAIIRGLLLFPKNTKPPSHKFCINLLTRFISPFSSRSDLRVPVLNTTQPLLNFFSIHEFKYTTGATALIKTGNDITEATTTHADPGSALARPMHSSRKEDAWFQHY